MTEAAVKQTVKVETVAERYERLKATQFETFLAESFSEETLAKVQLFEVKVPSGMVFKCRPIGLDYFRNAGALPMSFMEQAMTGEIGADAFNEMSPTEKVAAIQMTTRMVLYICVEPRLLVGTLNGHKNALSVDQLTMADFEHLANWAKLQTEGGTIAPGLKTFRKRRK